MATQLDYYNTLLASETGRKVYADLKKMGYTWFRKLGVDINPEERMMQCVLDEFVMKITENCGINNPDAEMKMLAAEAKVAATELEKTSPEPIKRDLLDTEQ